MRSPQERASQVSEVLPGPMRVSQPHLSKNVVGEMVVQAARLSKQDGRAFPEPPSYCRSSRVSFKGLKDMIEEGQQTRRGIVGKTRKTQTRDIDTSGGVHGSDGTNQTRGVSDTSQVPTWTSHNQRPGASMKPGPLQVPRLDVPPGRG